jgi:hypothetical protein
MRRFCIRHQTFTIPTLNVRPENIFRTQTFSIFKNVRTKQNQIKAIIERGYMIMKKFVSIVLTTGLLMGTVAFGALACGVGDQERGQPISRQKKVVVVQKRERPKPPVVKRVHPKPGKKLVVKVRSDKPGVVKVAVKPAPASKPAPQHDKRAMPQDGPGRR